MYINEGKIKYMSSTSRDMRCIGSQITADDYIFDVGKEIRKESGRNTLFLFLMPT